MAEWEKVDSVPKAKAGAPARFELAPGEVVRKVVKSNSTATGLTSNFKRQGRTDYHAGMRTIDGVRYVYIWRDPIKETDRE